MCIGVGVGGGGGGGGEERSRKAGVAYPKALFMY